MRTGFVIGSLCVLVGIALGAQAWPPLWWTLLLVVPLVGLGCYDMLQQDHAILRNFPILGHGRYLAEMIRPEIAQYFIESNTNGRPFSREQRSLVYQRAKGELDTLPFGTQQDVYAEGSEWLEHSLLPLEHVDLKAHRVRIGGPKCTRPYEASLFNISAMSFGSLSANAVLALNRGAHQGNFAHNTGEGGISRYHREGGGDLIYQLGTGYFGARAPAGDFSPQRFQETLAAAGEQVRMIEIKLSQGAKPGHGGILPAPKVTAEIAEARGIPVGKSCVSPPAHRAFSSAAGLLEFVARVRELAEGRPVGIKLCVGRRSEFLGLCLAMRESGLRPDFIAIDGGEGGTGAAPLEFSNSLGLPLSDGLAFAHDALVGLGLRDDLRLLAAGRIVSGFDLLRLFALGADVGYSARAMMFALGCIQALRCNSNHCPTGIATHDPALTVGLVAGDKAERVARYHGETLDAAAHLLAACGLHDPADLRRRHLCRRISFTEVRTYEEIWPSLEPGALLGTSVPAGWQGLLEDARRTPFYAGASGA